MNTIMYEAKRYSAINRMEKVFNVYYIYNGGSEGNTGGGGGPTPFSLF
jgi:hypothetical protein